MDPISKILTLNIQNGSVDQNCLLNGDWQLPHAAGELPLIRWHTVVKGSAWLEIPSGQTYSLVPSTVLFLPHHSAHRLRHNHHEETHIVCGSLHLLPSARYFLAALPEVLSLTPQEEMPEHHWLLSTIFLLQQESNHLKPGSDALFSQQCATLLTLAIREWLGQTTADNNLLNLLLHPRLGTAVLKMLESPAYPWKVENLARLANMSRATFAKLFHQSLGETPVAVLTTLRLQKASQLLAMQSDSITNIAESVGYANDSSFHKAFVRHFGYTPGEYRKRVKAIEKHG